VNYIRGRLIAFIQVMDDDARAVAAVNGLKLQMAGNVDAPVVLGGFPKSGLNILRTGTICVFLKLPPPAGEGLGWGLKNRRLFPLAVCLIK
jgi:hypothetical protein